MANMLFAHPADMEHHLSVCPIFTLLVALLWSPLTIEEKYLALLCVFGPEQCRWIFGWILFFITENSCLMQLKTSLIRVNQNGKVACPPKAERFHLT